MRQKSLLFLLFTLLISCHYSQDELVKEEMKRSLTDEDYQKHIAALKKKLPHNGFHIVLEKPFVVIGDESLTQVKRRAIGTVRWAATKLKASYFEKDPSSIHDIWLFKNKASYDTNTKKLFGSKPGTPFGYYSESEKALIMNIGTGGGTLVHEMVHVFMAENFPECPSWFNEGFASLYEQCSERNGRIIGLTNWRLKGLQRAIYKKSVPSFKALCATTTYQFYEKDPGTNYSQGRYLCYYLQEKGLLKKYFSQFRANVKQDPTGYQTLKKVLSTDDMSLFKKNWEKFVLKLQFS